VSTTERYRITTNGELFRVEEWRPITTPYPHGPRAPCISHTAGRWVHVGGPHTSLSIALGWLGYATMDEAVQAMEARIEADTKAERPWVPVGAEPPKPACSCEAAQRVHGLENALKDARPELRYIREAMGDDSVIYLPSLVRLMVEELDRLQQAARPVAEWIPYEQWATSQTTDQKEGRA